MYSLKGRSARKRVTVTAVRREICAAGGAARHNDKRQIKTGCLFGRDALDAARDRLQAIEAECQDERDTVRQWIDSVCDSMTRRALRLRYLDGKSWSECARRMGYADESGPRKLVGKLWSK